MVAGGCEGSENNFETWAECTRRCKFSISDTTSNPDCEEACARFPGDGKGQEAERECIGECEDCIAGCDRFPGDGKGQQLKQECEEECMAMSSEVPPSNPACEEACDRFPAEGLGLQEERECIVSCNNCIAGCDRFPGDGKGQQMQQECEEECIAVASG